MPKPSDTLSKFILLSKPSVGFKNIPLLWFEMMDVSKIVGFVLPDWIAIQSGKTKPTILLTSIISNQSNGIFLNPTLGFDRRINLLNVSDGLGNHLPEPCSEQLGP